MQAPAKPANESARLDALREPNILDTTPEERFDRVTRLAKRLFGVPIALVSLVDENRQWFKSAQGLDATETPRDISFCGHAILDDEIFLVPDARRDLRFHDNPLVTGEPHIRFYAGCPLSAPDGSRLGTLCIIDRKPGEMDADDLALMHDLARMAEQELAAVTLATMDDLTTVSNRRGFEALGEHALSLCERLRKPASLLFFDLNLFKQINDRFGHAEGDRALVSFAQLLRDNFRDSDVIGRLGGDEFVVLLTNADDDELPSALARLRESTERHNRKSSLDYEIAYSVGTVNFDIRRHDTIAQLIAEADKAMYESKAQRRSDNVVGEPPFDHLVNVSAR